MFVSREQILAARTTDLYSYLYDNYLDKFVIEGESLRYIDNPSISIKKGFSGYYDFALESGGNSIDFLMDYLEYSFPDAVSVLAPFNSPAGTVAASLKRKFNPPVAAATFAAAEDYLLGRGLWRETLAVLQANHLVYQDTRRNVVFLNKDNDFYEIRGTCPGKPFHQCQRLKTGAYWSYALTATPKRAFICESSIDALSLMQLHLADPSVEADAAYCGIAGVSNQAAILQIAKQYPLAILAVDNDAAGDSCRERNPSFPSIRPCLKDWNEDLLNTKERE